LLTALPNNSTEALGFRNKLKGTIDKPIVFRGVDREAVILTQNKPVRRDQTRFFVLDGCTHVWIQDMTIAQVGTAIVARNTQGLVVTGVVFDSISDGIWTSNSFPNFANDWWIVDNVFKVCLQCVWGCFVVVCNDNTIVW
jgi:hypothetical protein